MPIQALTEINRQAMNSRSTTAGFDCLVSHRISRPSCNHQWGFQQKYLHTKLTFTNIIRLQWTTFAIYQCLLYHRFLKTVTRYNNNFLLILVSIHETLPIGDRPYKNYVKLTHVVVVKYSPVKMRGRQKFQTDARPYSKLCPSGLRSEHTVRATPSLSHTTIVTPPYRHTTIEPHQHRGTPS